MSEKIRVAIIDDSLFMRRAIKNMLVHDTDIEIVAVGKNGLDAIEIAATIKPDVMTLDVEMPKKDGLSALEHIMAKTPLPVIMLSSLTTDGAEATLRALDLGAIDFIAKDSFYAKMGVLKISTDLQTKIHRFATDKRISDKLTAIKLPAQDDDVRVAVTSHTGWASTPAGMNLVVIGISTGGPQSLQKVIPNLRVGLGVPVLIVQHMPAGFTASLTARLASLSQVKVKEAETGQKLCPGIVYVAQGNSQLLVKKIDSGVYIDVEPAMDSSRYNPCVNITMESTIEAYDGKVLGVIMTGMGSDGRDGMRSLKEKSGFVIAQDQESCVVYGMPKAVIDNGIADEVVPLYDIASRIHFHTAKRENR